MFACLDPDTRDLALSQARAAATGDPAPHLHPEPHGLRCRLPGKNQMPGWVPPWVQVYVCTRIAEALHGKV